MTESQDSTEMQQGVSAAAPGMPDTSLGRCLREARQARGLSIDDVAQAIKFSPRQIEAIESDDFEKLPGAPIVRGFIRSYAKLLRLEPGALLAMFDKQVPPVVVTMQVLTDTGAALPQAGERRGLSGKSVGIVAACAVITAVAWAFYYWSPIPVVPTAATSAVSAPPPPAAPVASTASAAVETAATLATPDTAAVATNTAGVLGESSVAATVEKAADLSTANAAMADPDARQLIFVFDGKSWVEVKDASKHIIFAQNNLPGTRQVVTGKPPFVVVIGNASHVQLLYEERQIDLQPYTKVDVARLNLE